MPKTLGEWLFLASIGLFFVLGALNQVVATLCFIGSLVLGYREGFDTALIAMSLIFGFLLMADLASVLIAKPEKILKSVWPNLFVASVRFVYLVFAGLLFYGLFWGGGLVKYYWAYLIVAIWLSILNMPWMIFHLALCVPECQRYLSKMDKEIKSSIQENEDKNCKLWEMIDGLPGGDKNPFDTPVGPTNICLSTNQMVTFVENNARDEHIKQHLEECQECLNRLNRLNLYKSVR